MAYSQTGDSALVVLVPEADPIVGAWRDEHDPSAAQEQMPAHLTVLVPFMPEVLIDAGVVDSLATFYASLPACPLEFRSINAWPGTIWLDPESEACTHLLAATHQQWPQFLPYGRTDIEPIPHLTVGHGVPDEVADRIRLDLTPKLPITSRLDAVDLMVFDGERWNSAHRFPLATA